MTKPCAYALVGLCGLAMIACGSGAGRDAAGAPQTKGEKVDAIVGEPPGWSDTNQKSAALYQEGKYSEAFAVLETFARDHPGFAGAELMLADNYLTAPADDAALKRERREKAVAHFRRGIELATDDMDRDWGYKRLLRLYSTNELDRPADAETVARAFTHNHPADIFGYTELATALRRQQKFDEATTVLREAGTHVEESGRLDFAEALVTHADESPSLSAANQRQLLADAGAVVDPVLTARPNDVQALRIKRRMLSVEARLEPNPARRKALEAESK